MSQPAKEWSQIHHHPQLAVESLHAFLNRHAYPRHSHDYYVICLVERGIQSFTYQGVRHFTPPNGLIFLNPGDVHTGEPADRRGFEYRAIYPTLAHMQLAAAELGRGLPFFSQVRVDDPQLTNSVRALHLALRQDASLLEQESRFLLTLTALIKRYASLRGPDRPLGHERLAVQQACDYIQTHYAQGLSLNALAGQVGLSPYYFLRVFRAEVGLPPHAYLESVRIQAAQAALLAGQPIAQVAHATGFSSQSHFTNRFKKFIGVTPGQYVR